MSEHEKYYLPQYLDEPRRIVLWTWDELMVFLIPFALIDEMTNQLLLSVFVGGACFVLLKKLKGDKDHHYLKVLIYWYLPPILYFRKIPPSFIREYIG